MPLNPNRYMPWGFEHFAHFDAFTIGLPTALILLVFIFLFPYFSLRGYIKKPSEKALQISGYTFLFALILAFTSIPSMWTGFLLVIIYALAQKYVLKTKLSNWIKNLLTLWIILSIFAIVDDFSRILLTIISIFYIYI